MVFGDTIEFQSAPSGTVYSCQTEICLCMSSVGPGATCVVMPPPPASPPPPPPMPWTYVTSWGNMVPPAMEHGAYIACRSPLRC